MIKPETETFTCGQCGKPVLTYWHPEGKGLLPGSYALLGDVMFHEECCDEYLKEFPN